MAKDKTENKDQTDPKRRTHWSVINSQKAILKLIESYGPGLKGTALGPFWVPYKTSFMWVPYDKLALYSD